MTVEQTKQITNSLTLSFKASELVGIREKQIQSLSCRVFEDGKIYSSNALGDVDTETLKETAVNNPYGAIEYKYEYRGKDKISTEGGVSLSEEQLIQVSNDFAEKIKSEMPDFLFSGKVEYTDKSYQLTNENGGDYKESLKNLEGFLILKRKGSPNIMDSVFPYSSHTGKVDLDNSGLFFEMHRKFDDTVAIEKGKYPVMFVMDQGFMAKFKEGLDPTFYHNNACYYANKLGEKIFNEKINLTDTRYDESKGLFNKFDDEGNAIAAKLPVIENGVFKNIFYDQSAATKYCKEATGNGRRQYNTSIRTQPYHLDFETTGESVEEVFKANPKVIVAVLAGGGDTSSNGDYSSPVQVAFMVENGEVQGRLENLNVNNSIDKMMGDDFIAVTKDQLVPLKENPFVCYMNAF
jgi:hypothetical protein